MSFDAFGPLKFGSTVKSAEKALGMRLRDETPDPHEDCHYVSNERELPGVRFMVESKRIVRVDITSDAVLTSGGVFVGVSEDGLKVLYPEIQITDDKYDVDGTFHDLTLTSADKEHALLFESKAGVVVAIRAGEREPVSYAEGCL